MKKILSGFLILTFIAQVSFAHPPSKIDVAYDNASGILEVYVLHNVGNPETHFIKEIRVNVNGENVITAELFNQTDNKGTSASYSLPNLVAGDIVIVRATCNRIGRLSKKIIIEGPEVQQVL